MSIHVKTAAGWQVLGPGELPGLGGWAEITSVWDGSGAKPNRYAYNDGPGGSGGFDWVAFEWTDDGELRTDAGGLMDALLVSGGNGAGGAGLAHRTTLNATQAPMTVTVSISLPIAAGAFTSVASFLGPFNSGSGRVYGGAGSTLGGNMNDSSNRVGVTYDITGTDKVYGEVSGSPKPNSGDGGISTDGAAGVVIVRVPAAQAAGVDPNEYVDVP